MLLGYGLVLILLSAMFFALTSIWMKKALVETTYTLGAVFITILVGMFLISPFVVNELHKLFIIPLDSILYLSAAGIIHFVLGRALFLYSIRTIGVIRSQPLLSTSILYSSLFGILLLNERFTVSLLLGVILMYLAISVVVIEKSTNKSEKHIGILHIGAAFGFAAGFAYGISPIFVRAALIRMQLPLLGTFISYVSASFVMGILLLGTKRRVGLPSANSRPFNINIIVASIFLITAQMLKYSALNFVPVSVTGPLENTSVLFTLLFSALFIKTQEIFNIRTVFGTLIVFLSTILIVQA